MKQEEIRERRADREMELGMFKTFDSVESLLADLHSPSHILCPFCSCIFYPETASAIHCGGNS